VYKRRVRDATGKAANAQIVEHQHRLPFAAVWGDGRLSSSHGQRFAAPPGTLIGAYQPRHFGYYDRAVSVYSHLSDRLGVYGTLVISCAPREATYVLTGILDNDTSIDPEMHTTDTHGFTEALWGLCYLLGIDFMPRLRDLADQRLWRINNSQIPDSLTGLFAGNADAVAITEQWEQLVRIAASLKARTAPAHVVLQRLTAGGPSDRVAKALTALSRLVKTRHILRYLHDGPLRLRIQTQLNRGEARHGLARWLFFADQGAFDRQFGADPSTQQLEQWDLNREMTFRIAWKPYMYNASLPHLLGGVKQILAHDGKGPVPFGQLQQRTVAKLLRPAGEG